MRRWRWGLLLAAVVLGTRAGDEIDYVEDFALAKDREAALKQLLPGTPEFYYYSCLNQLNQGKLAEAEATLKQWTSRHGEPQQFKEMQHRWALLLYAKDPKRSLDYLRRELGLNFSHQREELDPQTQYPTRLDPALVSRQLFAQLALRDRDSISRIADPGLEFASTLNLTPEQRRNLLQRLRFPDLPRLVELVDADLGYQYSGGFGSIPIHRQLTLAQLDELLKRRPDLRQNEHFVYAWLARLRPAGDVDWDRDAAARVACYQRFWGFAAELPPSFNSLKACILYHWLNEDLRQGRHDRERFLAYLKLPRPVPYILPAYLQGQDLRRYMVNLGANFREPLALPPIRVDEPLVREYLLYFLADAEDYKEYADYVLDGYLKDVFAEAKLLAGVGNPERWYSLVSPARYQELNERVDIDFDRGSQEYLGAKDPIRLKVWLKNVPTLIVKVYNINALNYYREQEREVNLDVELDGLVPNAEKEYKYDSAPIRRVARTFEFPELTQPGVYVIELIGKDKRSRAVVHKGTLRYLVRQVNGGQLLTLLDEANTKVANGAVWMGGRRYAADADGHVLLPFSGSAGTARVVLEGAGGFTLATIPQRAENYRLTAAMIVEREALRRDHTAKLLIRPQLALNDEPAPLALLEDPVLRLQSVDLEGVGASQEFRGFKLEPGKDLVFDFKVPDNLASLAFTLSAEVASLTQGRKLPVRDTVTIALNQIDTQTFTSDVHLLCSAGSYALDLLGKSGEPRANRPLGITLKHRFFTAERFVQMQTDAQGRLQLGPLPEIEWVKAALPGREQVWQLAAFANQARLEPDLHLAAGAPLRLPYTGTRPQVDREAFGLLELRGSLPSADRFDKLSLRNGFLEAADLAPGDYLLRLKETGRELTVRVAAGPKVEEYLLGARFLLEQANPLPLQITEIGPQGDTLRLRLANADAETRVHVLAARYAPDFPAWEQLARLDWPGAQRLEQPAPPSVYQSGRKIGDEYAYVIARRYQKKLPGNLLHRPDLLLNPFELRTTTSAKEQLREGEVFAAAPEPAAAKMSRRAAAAGEAQAAAGAASFGNIDFLATPGLLIANLKPDADGVIALPLAQLQGRQHLQVLALSDRDLVARTVTLAERPEAPRDLRLLHARAHDQHFVESQQVQIVRAGAEFKLADIATSSFQVYDNLESVYGLYRTLNPDPNLLEFSFLLQWPSLKPEEKREKYSKYACHELSFFLYRKDPEFFRTVILPYLKNKKDKTFLDEWLVEAPVDKYLEPWRFARLNTFEKALLAQRLKGEGPIMKRWVQDLLDTQPRDLDRENFLFKTALRSASLATGGDSFGVDKAKQELLMRSERASGAKGGALGDAAGTVANALGAGDGRALPSSAPVTALSMAAPAAPAPAMAPVAAPKAELAKELSAKDADALDEAKPAAAVPARARALRSASEKKSDRPAELAEYRRKAPQLYRPLDQTKEWAENNYYKLPIEKQDANLVPVRAFWNDYAAWSSGPFYSAQLAEACGNFTEMMLALAVLDLPYSAEAHASEVKDAAFRLTAKSPLIVFSKQIQSTAAPDGQVPILVSQNYFRDDDRYRFENGERFEKYVRDEFVIDVVYGCQVVVTNPTSNRQKLDLLLEIPRGAMPVANGFYTRNLHWELEPYQTQTLDYRFYFPAAGAMPHFPVHVAREGKLMAAAAGLVLKVVAKPEKLDTESWQYVSQFGTPEQVLAYLRDHNLNRLDLAKIAFRVRTDRAYFASVVALLRQRHAFNETLWSYGIYHNDPQTVREYLPQVRLAAQCGPWLDSPLLRVDPVERLTYQHLEYYPLVNPRAHQLGTRRQILNERLREQYHRLLRVLACKPALDQTDRLAVSYYLLLQDRIDEAQSCFAQVKPADVATRLQLDYMKVYLAMSQGDAVQARKLAETYRDYPVPKWRDRFADALAQLDEAAGKAAAVQNREDRDQVQGALAAGEPSLDFRLDGSKVELSYQNLASVTVNYYLMDLELMFSRQPFMQGTGKQFSYIQPNQTSEVALPAPAAGAPGKLGFELPQALRSKNVLVEIRGGGQVRTQAYYANSLSVQMLENYGQLKVTRQDNGKPLAAVYVKVYARMSDGSVRFYKDGYTDLRGRFDYSSLNSNDMDSAERFAVLVLSDENGGVGREVAPPKR